MIAILSPAKTLNMKVKVPAVDPSQPRFLDEAEILVRELRNYDPRGLARLMDISPKLADENFERYAHWSQPFTQENARPAILAFNGEVYRGLEATTMDPASLAYAQDHVRILSGLYGILRPLDLIRAYRLEMGTALENPAGKDLYAFWGDRLYEELKQELKSHREPVLLNLASREYYRSVERKEPGYRVITPEFRELRGDHYTMITVYAKKARGLMTRFMLENRIEKAADLKHFDLERYRYNEQESTEDTWVFTR